MLLQKLLSNEGSSNQVLILFWRELDPVVAAIKDGDENAVCNMMKSGKDLSEPNKDGWIPLHEAAYYGQVGCLSLLQKGQWS